jgi:hypothetical protein
MLSIRFGLISTTLVLAAGCATLAVDSYTRRGTDIGQFQTYMWGPPDTVATGDPRLDSNPFFENAVRRAVDEGLKARRYTITQTLTADLIVHYHASAAQRVDVGAADEQLGYSQGAGEPYVFEAGTVTVDLIDSRNKTLVWRGWALSGLDGIVDDQRALERHVSDVVRQILRRLPSRAD